MPQRMQLRLAATSVTVVLAVTGCTTSAATAPKATPAAATTAASPSAAPGCAQATAAVLAARHDINARDFAAATTRIADLRDALPDGKLKVDAALAAVKLAFLNEDVTQGNPVYQDLKDSRAALDKISADCAPGK